MFNKQSEIAPSILCWIYVLQSRAKPQYEVGYTINLSERMQQLAGHDARLVYVRRFDDFADAIGHKLFLEKISTDSLRRIIKRYNNSKK